MSRCHKLRAAQSRAECCVQDKGKWGLWGAAGDKSGRTRATIPSGKQAGLKQAETAQAARRQPVDEVGNRTDRGKTKLRC